MCDSYLCHQKSSTKQLKFSLAIPIAFAVKAQQKVAVGSFLRGNDVFVSLPTGYGKSICFALPPLVFDRVRKDAGSIVICISPLTALMMEHRTNSAYAEYCRSILDMNKI